MGVQTTACCRAVRVHLVQHLRSRRCGLVAELHRLAHQMTLICLGASMAVD